MTWSPGFTVRDAGADLAHDAGAFVAEDRRETPLGIEAGERVGVGVADARRHDLDQHLARFRTVEVDGLDGEFLLRLPGDRGARFHAGILAHFSSARRSGASAECLDRLIQCYGSAW